jgi:hypothetical protein
MSLMTCYSFLVIFWSSMPNPKVMADPETQFLPLLLQQEIDLQKGQMLPERSESVVISELFQH